LAERQLPKFFAEFLQLDIRIFTQYESGTSCALGFIGGTSSCAQVPSMATDYRVGISIRFKDCPRRRGPPALSNATELPYANPVAGVASNLASNKSLSEMTCLKQPDLPDNKADSPKILDAGTASDISFEWWPGTVAIFKR
jgi:hypothetical protein